METKLSFSCITCRLSFNDAEDQRNHYRSPWHCFNLKRKMANFLPVTEEIFNQKVAELKQKNQKDANMEKKKPQRLSKKTHRYRKGSTSRTKPLNLSHTESEIIPKEVTEAVQDEVEEEKKINDNNSDSPEEKEMTEEELIEERLKSAKPVPVTESLFDGKKFSAMEDNIKYIQDTYGFFIPEIESLTDLAGLLTYLGEKIGIGYTCIYCAKEFYSLQAVRSHMIDKSHCKMSFYDSEEEYVDFYDLTKQGFQLESEQEQTEGDNKPLDLVKYNMIGELSLDRHSDVGELTLQNGNIIGHRSLARYYKQKLKPSESNEAVLLNRMVAQYRSLGMLSQRKKNEVNRKVLTVRQRDHMYLGIKANKINLKFYKSQVDF